MPVIRSTIGTPTFCGPPPGWPSSSPVTLISPPMRLDQEVVGRLVAPRAGLAEAGDRAVDQPRIDRAQRRRRRGRSASACRPCSSPARCRPARPARATMRWPSGLSRLDGDRALAAVDGEVVAGLAWCPCRRASFRNGGPQRAGVVAGAGALDLDHVGAEVGEDLAGPGRGQDAAQVEHPDVRQRAGHVSIPLGPAVYFSLLVPAKAGTQSCSEMKEGTGFPLARE